MSVNLFRNAADMPDDFFDGRRPYPGILAHRHERMPGVVGGVGREGPAVDLAHIYPAMQRIDVALFIRHDQVIILGKQADGVKVFDQGEDAVRYGDGPVLSRAGLDAAYHVLFFHVDVLHPDAGQLIHPQAGVGLDQDDFNVIILYVLP